MNAFIRFPHTPHLVWLGDAPPRDDKLMSREDALKHLSGEVVVEEKVDGANLGISLAKDGNILVQNRGQFLVRPYHDQFTRLNEWLATHKPVFLEQLGHNLILFGEWCAARHSIPYSTLPDWFVLFDVYDRQAKKFYCVRRRDDFATRLGLKHVPVHFRGRTTLNALTTMVRTARSKYRVTGGVEGFVIRREDHDWLLARAKLVHPDFVQSIGQHWSRRAIEWNQLRPSPKHSDIKQNP